MGIGSWLRRPAAPQDPVYSELGAEIYRLLEEEEEKWQVRDYAFDRQHGLGHFRSDIFIHVDRNVRKKGVVIQQGGEGMPTLNGLLTADDLSRITDRAYELMRVLSDRRRYEDMRRVLETLKPSPFDAACRQLARAVLSGDASAAHPMIDRALECLQENG